MNTKRVLPRTMALLVPSCFPRIRVFSTSGWLAVLAALQVSLLSALRAGEVSGPITANTVWAMAQSPVTVVDNLTVNEGATLTIEPGVRVRFGKQVACWIKGHLQAVGASNAPIVFEGTTGSAGWWRGLQVIEKGSATLDWCQVGHSGYWDQAGVLKAGTGSLSLKHSTLRDTAGDGLRVLAGASSFVSQDNLFQNNTRGARVEANASFDDVTSNFSGNTVDVLLDGGTMTGSVVWGLKRDYSLFLAGDTTIKEAAKLTIRPGTVLKFNQQVALWVDGRLEVVGTATAPIYLTDWRDDSVGGDGNRDGTTTKSAAGWWRMVNIRGNGSATLTHATLRFAGYWEQVGLAKNGPGTLTMSRCAISDTRGHGMEAVQSPGLSTLEECAFANNTHSGLYLKDGKVTATGCAFTANGDGGVSHEINDGLRYSANQFAGNGAASVVVNGGTLTVDATWTRGGGEDFTMEVRHDTTVAEGATLTIEPGVKARFGQQVGCWIKGRLLAVGTPGAPIVFDGTTPSAGWWRGLQLIEKGSAVLERCEVAHSGYWEQVGLLKTGAGSLALRNSVIRDNGTDGLRILAGSSSFVSENNTFRNNARGVRVGIDASFDDLTSTFSGNTMDLFLDGGTMTRDVTWGLRRDYSCFLSGDCTVSANAKLTIRPGVVLKFGQQVGLWVDGRLEALGSAAAPIYITDWRDDAVGGDANRDGATTKPGMGWWRMVLFRGTGSGSLAFLTLRHAGYWDLAGVYKTGSGELVMRQCSLTDTLGHGMRAFNNTENCVLEGCVFANNSQSGLYLNKGNVAAIGCAFSGNGDAGIHQEINDSLRYSANQFSGNQAASVAVNGGTMTTNVAWSRGGGGEFVISARNDITVAEGATLTIEPGVKTRFVQQAGCFVAGRLEAVGTVAAPIVFDGATASPGWWRGLLVSNKGSATLEWCQVAHSGYWDQVGLLKTGSGSLTFRNSTIRDNSVDGLRIENSTGSHLLERCALIGNRVGLLIRNQQQPLAIHESRIAGNATHGVLNLGQVEIDARRNWWGHATGPRHATKNPAGQGDVVSDLVLFDPWSAEPPTIEEPPVTAPPRLAIEINATGDLIFSWPASMTGVFVETSLDMKQWVKVAAAVTQVGDRSVYQTKPQGPTRYYRLVKES